MKPSRGYQGGHPQKQPRTPLRNITSDPSYASDDDPLGLGSSFQPADLMENGSTAHPGPEVPGEDAAPCRGERRCWAPRAGLAPTAADRSKEPGTALSLLVPERNRVGAGWHVAKERKRPELAGADRWVAVGSGGGQGTVESLGPSS